MRNSCEYCMIGVLPGIINHEKGDLLMRPRFPIWSSGLVLALLAVACASAAPTESAPPVELTASVVPTSAAETAVPAAEATASVVLPVATSRGPNLEATDPATVSLASGGLQLVEFFRFT